MFPNSRPRPEPSQRGSLAKTPLAHLLVYAHDRALTGTFDFAVGEQRSTLVVVNGRPIKARTHLPVPYLGRVLLEMGAITQEQLDETLVELAKTRRLHGQILMEHGFVEHTQLLDGLREQLRRKLDALFDLGSETIFEYFADFDGLADYGGKEELAIDPWAAVWRGIRRQPSWDHVQSTLSHLGAARVRVSRGANIERFELSRAERELVDVMRAKPMMPHELAGTNLIAPKLVQLLLYTFAITKQISLVAPDASPDDSASYPSMDMPPPSSSSVRSVSQTAPPPSPSNPAAQVARVSLRKTLTSTGRFAPVEEVHAPRKDARSQTAPPPAVAGAAKVALPRPPTPPIAFPPAAAVAPPPATAPTPAAAPAADPALAARRKEILDRAAGIEKEDYFAMLGVPREANGQMIRAAYFELARRWHPDKLPADLSEVKAACAKVFAKITEAHQTLADDAQRARYIDQLKKGAAAQESEEDRAKVEVVIEAAMSYQKAEVCFKRNDFVQAEAMCRRAVELDGTQAEYFAMLAWLEAMKPANQSKEATLERIRDLDRALGINERCERAYFFRAQLHKRIGNDDAAYRDFKKSFELNPRNLDAQREVRLLEMRKGVPKEKDKKEEKGGIFSRFFKK